MHAIALRKFVFKIGPPRTEGQDSHAFSSFIARDARPGGDARPPGRGAGSAFERDAAVDGDYAWLGVVIVIGSMISLAYYLKVIAAMWMAEAPVAGTALQTSGQPALAGGSAEADTPRIEFETWFVALLFGAATLFFGIVPSPLFNLAVQAGRSLTHLF
jgi:NADH-quinone oxidoreductase subunit N